MLPFTMKANMQHISQCVCGLPSLFLSYPGKNIPYIPGFDKKLSVTLQSSFSSIGHPVAQLIKKNLLSIILL